MKKINLRKKIATVLIMALVLQCSGQAVLAAGPYDTVGSEYDATAEDTLVTDGVADAADDGVRAEDAAADTAADEAANADDANEAATAGHEEEVTNAADDGSVAGNPDETGVPEEDGSAEPDFSDSISADTVSDDTVSEDEIIYGEVSENTTVSYDSAAPDPRKEFIDGRIKAINELLANRLETMPVMAVLYMCDTYPLRSEPSYDAECVAEVECGATLYLQSASFNEAEYWFEVVTYIEDEEVRGYIPQKMFVCVDEEYLAWAETLSDMPTVSGDAVADDAEYLGGDDEATYEVNLDQQAKDSIYNFPNEYREYLLKLWEKHPKWIFVPMKTGISLEDAVSEEHGDKSWIGSSADSSYKEKPAKQSGWYIATKKAIRYYMNPVNFLSEKRVFMFEQLTYNTTYHKKSGVQYILNGTFMEGNIPSTSKSYADAFMEIGSKTKVSPYHQASRVRQEQGTAGSSGIISGTYPGYQGYYNYYNIKATGATNAEIITNGLKYAKDQGWNTRYKALEGGANFIGKNYIAKGQDTLYLEKFNVTTTNRYNHQYMQNIVAPYAESGKTYDQYKEAGALNNAFVFKIPVYTGGTYDTWKDADLAAIKEAVKGAEFYALTNAQPYLKNVSLASIKAKLTDGVTVSWKAPNTALKAKAGVDTTNYSIVFNKPYCLPEEGYKVPVHVTTYTSLTLTDVTNQKDLGYLQPINTIQGAREAIFEVKSKVVGYCPEDWATRFSLEFKADISGKLKDGTSPVEIKSSDCLKLTPEEMCWNLRVGVTDAKKDSLTKSSVGTLTLTVGYDKAGKLYTPTTRKLAVTYINTAPLVDLTKGTVNAWKQEGTKVSILSQNGVSVDKVTLFYRGAESSIFAINGSDGNWYLELKDEAKKQLRETGKGVTQKLTLTAYSKNGESVTKTVTAVASVAKPAVTFKQLVKPNLYYTKDTEEAKAGYILSASIPIEGVETSTTAASLIEETGRPYFKVQDFDAATRLLTLDTKGLDMLNTAAIYKKSPVLVKLEGYDPIPYVISVKTVNTKPSVKAASGIIYGNMDTAYLRLTTAAALPADVVLSSNDIYTEAVLLPDQKAIRIRALEGFKPGTKKFTLSSETWRAPVKLSAKVSKAAAPAIKLSNKKVVLNSSLSLARNGSYDVSAMASGSDLGVSLTSVMPANAKSQMILDQGYLKATVSDGRVSFGLVPEKRGIIKAGTYTYDIAGVLDTGTDELKSVGLKPARMTVTISDKAPASLYSLKASGKINLVNRAGSYVAYTPTIKSLCASSVSAVEIGEVGGEYFTAELIKKGERFPSGAKNAKTAGTILLRAKPGVSMSRNFKYPVQIVSTLNNGLVVKKTLKVKPVQSPKKTRGRVSSLLIPINGAPGLYTIASAGATVSDSAIEKVELVKDKNGLLFDYDPVKVTDPRTATGTIRVNKNIQKLGKYTLKFRVTYKDHALNVKPSVIKLSVTVR